LVLVLVLTVVRPISIAPTAVVPRHDINTDAKANLTGNVNMGATAGCFGEHISGESGTPVPPLPATSDEQNYTVIARSKATKQSRLASCLWIASLRSQ
jgi:hypothetical protein